MVCSGKWSFWPLTTWKVKVTKMRTFTFGATKKRPMISHKPPIRVIFCCKSEKCQLGIFHFVGRKSSGQNVHLIYGCEIKLPIWKLDFWILASYQNGNLPLLKQNVPQSIKMILWKLVKCQFDTLPKRNITTGSQLGNLWWWWYIMLFFLLSLPMPLRAFSPARLSYARPVA